MILINARVEMCCAQCGLEVGLSRASCLCKNILTPSTDLTELLGVTSCELDAFHLHIQAAEQQQDDKQRDMQLRQLRRNLDSACACSGPVCTPMQVQFCRNSAQ